MRRSWIAVVTCCICLASGGIENRADASDKYWPQWRGPDATGVAPDANPPIEWSETKNIRWKVEIPGLAHASPVVWGDRVYIQTAVETDRKGQAESGNAPSPRDGGGGRRMSAPPPTNIHQFNVLGIDRRSGKTVWETTVREAVPHEGGHKDSTQASGSPVTDGKHIVAFFGSRGLHGLDMKGKLLWSKDLGTMKTRAGFGEGASPALYGDTIVVVFDHEGDSFIAAFDVKTGEQRWKVDRDEPTGWATPVVVEANGKPQVVAAATNFVRGYDLKSGKLVWQCGGMTRNVIPCPMVGNGLLYAISGFRGTALLAIDYAAAKGDITDSAAVAWKYSGGDTPYVPSGVLYDDKLYFLKVNTSILSCVDAKAGTTLYNDRRLEGLGSVYASLVGAGGRVYVVDRDGATAVVKHGSDFELLATNKLDDSFDASPAVVDNEIYLRGRKHLYCIARD